ncbi:hypothetical protein IMZ48_44110 [Candidatus Bathyarchaeota archaeon]|nr:hypothetical protein [Candidatus Bathyarchaeota archaeon]
MLREASRVHHGQAQAFRGGPDYTKAWVRGKNWLIACAQRRATERSDAAMAFRPGRKDGHARERREEAHASGKKSSGAQP